MNLCPICQSPISEYKFDGIQRICWSCGHYESDSPACRDNPALFENMVRENPTYFLKKFLKLRPSDEKKQYKDSDGEVTVPVKRGFISSQLIT